MTMVPVPADVAVTAETVDGFEVTMPARRNIFALCFLPLWLVGWVFGEVAVSHELLTATSLDPQRLFLVVWLAGWTLGGGFALLIWLWMLAGRERVVLGHAALSVGRELFGLRRVKDYDLASVRNLRAGVVPGSAFATPAAARFAHVIGGSLQFDYGSKTIRFGASLEEAEAKRLCATFLARRPSLRPHD